MTKRFVSIGEAMIEMSGGEGGMYRLGYAGDTLNTAWYAKALLPEDWQVDYVTALGDDMYSGEMRAFIAKAGIGTDRIQTIANRRPGLYMIHQEKGDRHFTYWRGQSAAKQLADDVEALEAAVVGADTVYFSGISMANPRAAGPWQADADDRQGARCAARRWCSTPTSGPRCGRRRRSWRRR